MLSISLKGEKKDKMRSPLVYFGGKSRLAPKLIKLFCKHKCYVEPFGGAASVLFAKKPSEIEIYNDIDDNVVNFFRVLRDDTLFPVFVDKVRNTPYARIEFK